MSIKRNPKESIPGAAKPAAEPAADNASNIIPEKFDFSAVMQDEEFVATTIEHLTECSAAIQDIPAQIEQLGRIALAKAFVFPNAQRNGMDFDAVQFERAWAHLNSDQTPENPA